MLQVTEGRIRNFCRTVLEQGGEARNIGFVDVGSGGELKEPWALLPAERVSTFDFEPTRGGGSGLPLCVSDGSGTAPFFVAHDERGSSFHKPLQVFVDRYALDGMLTKKTITVERVSLDEYFSGRYEQVDAIDINVEGHDLQVLQGATRLLAAGAHIVGTNCGNGMKRMVEIIAQMRAAAPEAVILVHANAGLPQSVNGVDVFPETPDEMAAQVPALVAAGAHIIGGCCGTTPAHIQAMKAAVAKLCGSCCCGCKK